MRIANVIPATRLAQNANQVFSYLIPPTIQEVKIGMVVEISFGKKIISAVITDILPDPEPEREKKPLLRVLYAESILTPQLLTLAKRLSDYYLEPQSLFIKHMIPKATVRAKYIQMNETKKLVNHIRLNKHQTLALDYLKNQLGKSAEALLWGVTGSGKTEIYMNLIEILKSQGKQTLMLVPAIVLTPQIKERFAKRFGSNDIAVIHSKISYGQKSLIWKKVFNNEINVLIGPRSAVFAPFKNLGMIIIDEEHDSSYKQSEQHPKFHARTACRILSEIWSCPLLLGDATPSLETFFSAKSESIKLLSLPERIGQQLPAITLVDMREESKKGNFSIFSETLLQKIKLALKKKMTVILFINRRGYATSLSCQDCNQPVLCNRCSSPLVYHATYGMLICHHCEKKYEIPKLCANCGSHRLKLSGTGSEKVESSISELFPNAKILRFDRDVTSKKSAMDLLYKQLVEKKIDIAVGTQMLAKGWDLKHVGLIGVINTDTTLSLPDYRSAERTFQLITQVAGRAGRGDFPGEAVFQSYNPNNFAVKSAIKHDYEAFFNTEILFRKEHGYPPFSKLIKCTVKSAHQAAALNMSQKLTDLLNENSLPEVEIIGPAPSFIPKIRNKYLVYVIIKVKIAGNRALPGALVKILRTFPGNWEIDVEPDNLL